MRRWMMSAALVLVWAATASAQGGGQEFSKEPGYVDLQRFGDLQKGKEVVEVYLTQPLLSAARWAMIKDDPDLAEMLGNLQLLRVNVFSFPAEQAKSLGSYVDKVAATLMKENWSRVVKVNDEDGVWNILVKMDEKRGEQEAPVLNGLVLVGIGGEDSDIRYQEGSDLEAIFVNVVGQLDFSQLSKLGEHFDIPALEEIEEASPADSTDDSE